MLKIPDCRLLVAAAWSDYALLDSGAGAKLEVPAKDTPYGRIAMLADPFGHGFCLLQFNERGYDALLEA